MKGHCPLTQSESSKSERDTHDSYMPIQNPQCVAEHDLFVSFAGGGIYFFWQLGAVKFLQVRSRRGVCDNSDAHGHI